MTEFPSREDVQARQEYQDILRVADELDVVASQYRGSDDGMRGLTDQHADADTLILAAHERVKVNIPSLEGFENDPLIQQYMNEAAATLVSIWVDGFIVASRYAEAEHARD